MNEPVRDSEKASRREGPFFGFSNQEELLEAVENLRRYLATLKSWKETTTVTLSASPPSLN